MRSTARDRRAGWAVLLFALGAALAAACSDSPSDGEQGGGDGEAGARENGGGAGGSSPQGGTGGGGGDGPSTAAGGDGQAGEPGLGVATDGGNGALPACEPGTACLIDAECGIDETCVGGTPAKLCVLDFMYCDAQQPCVRRSAGCLANRCTPPLANGVACTSSTQCQSGLCDESGTCQATTECCEAGHSELCGEGYVCAWRGLGICEGDTCVAAIAAENEQCTGAECTEGTVCLEPEVGPYAKCTGGQQSLGQLCGVYDPNGPDKALIVNDCKRDLYCAPSAASGPDSCQKKPGLGASCAGKDAAGGPVKCVEGTHCGSDKRCQSNDGQDCSTEACQPGFRCASASRGGQCSRSSSACL